MTWDNPSGWDFDNIATYAHGVGPSSQWIMYYPSLTEVPIDFSSPSLFVDEMHKRNLAVHPYTLRDDSLQYTSNPAQETALYFDKGVDGIFTEFVQTTYSLFTLLNNPD